MGDDKRWMEWLSKTIVTNVGETEGKSVSQLVEDYEAEIPKELREYAEKKLQISTVNIFASSEARRLLCEKYRPQQKPPRTEPFDLPPRVVITETAPELDKKEQRHMARWQLMEAYLKGLRPYWQSQGREKKPLCPEGIIPFSNASERLFHLTTPHEPFPESVEDDGTDVLPLPQPDTEALPQTDPDDEEVEEDIITLLKMHNESCESIRAYSTHIQKRFYDVVKEMVYKKRKISSSSPAPTSSSAPTSSI